MQGVNLSKATTAVIKTGGLIICAELNHGWGVESTHDLHLWISAEDSGAQRPQVIKTSNQNQKKVTTLDS